MAKEGVPLLEHLDSPHDPDVPLMIPEVNPDHVSALEVQRRIAVGAGSSSPTRTAPRSIWSWLAAHDAFGIDALAVTTMQAVSGAGYPGVPSLDMIDNVVPFINTEEEKMTEETKKLLLGSTASFSRRASRCPPTATAFP